MFGSVKNRIDHSHLLAHLKMLFLFKNGEYTAILGLVTHHALWRASSALNNILETYSITRLQLKSVGAFTATRVLARLILLDALFTAKSFSISDSASCIDTHFEMNRMQAVTLGTNRQHWGMRARVAMFLH